MMNFFFVTARFNTRILFLIFTAIFKIDIFKVIKEKAETTLQSDDRIARYQMVQGIKTKHHWIDKINPFA